MSRGAAVTTKNSAKDLPFGFRGVLVERVRWGGVQFHAVVALNEHEIERRSAYELGPVLDFQLLDALAALPLSQPIEWDQIDPIQAAVLDCAPDGVVESTPMHVTNTLAAPVRLVGVFVVADHWRALGRIGSFGRVAPSGVVVRRAPSTMDDAIVAARGAGLGLAVLESHAPRAVVNPDAKVAHTTGRRRILEVVYGQWQRHTTRMPAKVHHAVS